MRHILKFAAALSIGALSILGAAPNDIAAASGLYVPSTPFVVRAQYYGDHHYGHCYSVCVRRDDYNHCIAYRKICE
jgi:hypothetical protein